MAFGFIGKAIKGAAKGIGKGLGAVGDIAKRAAPFASLVPGVGPLAGLALGAGGGLLGKLNDKDVTLGSILGDTLKGGAIGGLGSLGISKLTGGRGVLALRDLLGKAGGGGGGGGGGGFQADQYGAQDVGGGGGGGGGLGGLLSQFGGKISLPDLLLGGAGAISAASQQGKSNKVLEDAIARERAEYESRSPYREAALANLKTLQSSGGGLSLADRNRLGAAFADPENPFATPFEPEAAAEPAGPSGPAKKLAAAGAGLKGGGGLGAIASSFMGGPAGGRLDGDPAQVGGADAAEGRLRKYALAAGLKRKLGGPGGRGGGGSVSRQQRAAA